MVQSHLEGGRGQHRKEVEMDFHYRQIRFPAGWLGETDWLHRQAGTDLHLLEAGMDSHPRREGTD
jgi:hypothetical protein